MKTRIFEPEEVEPLFVLHGLKTPETVGSFRRDAEVLFQKVLRECRTEAGEEDLRFQVGILAAKRVLVTAGSGTMKRLRERLDVSSTAVA